MTIYCVSILIDTFHIFKVRFPFYSMMFLFLQKFLLRLPGGIFGKEGEATLLSVLSLQHKMEQFEAVHA